MIVDLERFLALEEPYWRELDAMIGGLERDPGKRLLLHEIKRLHYLYQRASSDLAKLRDFPNEPRVRGRLMSLVGRAYSEIHETRTKPHRLRPLRWFFKTFPQTFRRNGLAFLMTVLITLAGVAFGGGLIYADRDMRTVLMPFPHLHGDPSDRVADEERIASSDDPMAGARTAFSAQLMTHNTKVSILTMSMGMTYALGTIMLLFYNGVILGAVCVDYIMAGEVKFLAGWLLPHGVIEIPAILIAGQAGLVLGKALIGWGSGETVRARLRKVSGDLVTLIGGVALMLVWAGIVEAFFSQYHEPILPYWFKIAFGCAELFMLALFLGLSGREKKAGASGRGNPAAASGLGAGVGSEVGRVRGIG